MLVYMNYKCTFGQTNLLHVKLVPSPLNTERTSTNRDFILDLART